MAFRVRFLGEVNADGRVDRRYAVVPTTGQAVGYVATVSANWPMEPGLISMERADGSVQNLYAALRVTHGSQLRNPNDLRKVLRQLGGAMAALEAAEPLNPPREDAYLDQPGLAPVTASVIHHWSIWSSRFDSSALPEEPGSPGLAVMMLRGGVLEDPSAAAKSMHALMGTAALAVGMAVRGEAGHEG